MRVRFRPLASVGSFIGPQSYSVSSDKFRGEFSGKAFRGGAVGLTPPRGDPSRIWFARCLAS